MKTLAQFIFAFCAVVLLTGAIGGMKSHVAGASAPTPDWAWFKCDDGSGSSAMDSSANGNGMALTGSPTWATGTLGFNGSSQYGTASSAGINFQDNTAWTVTAWFKTSITAAGTIYGTWTYNVVGGSGIRLCMSDAAPGLWDLIIAADFSTPPNSLVRASHNSTTSNDGNLHFIVATYDGSGAAAGIKFYLDGVSDTAHVDTDTAPGTINNNNQYLARTGGSAAPQLFTGTINEIGVYSRVLTSTEITSLNTLGPR